MFMSTIASIYNSTRNPTGVCKSMRCATAVMTNDYGVSICINDDIVHIRKKEHEYTNNKLWLVRFFEKHSGKGQKNAHLRIHKGDVRSDVVAGDFMIEGDEFDAFMKTLELAKNFGTIPRFQP